MNELHRDIQNIKRWTLVRHNLRGHLSDVIATAGIVVSLALFVGLILIEKRNPSHLLLPMSTFAGTFFLLTTTRVGLSVMTPNEKEKLFGVMEQFLGVYPEEKEHLHVLFEAAKANKLSSEGAKHFSDLLNTIMNAKQSAQHRLDAMWHHPTVEIAPACSVKVEEVEMKEDKETSTCV